jgi:tetratricopeptide (TPR) repeat protein
VELDSTPFIAQERYQCGPASLAMLLQQSGIQVSAEELVPQVYLPARKGSLQAEMLATGRRYQRIPYPIDPTIAALTAELQAGRPVLVLQNLGLESRPLWHYAVVIGYSLADDLVILRSGTRERQLLPGWLFLKTWNSADSWAMVLLYPGRLPARPDRIRYLGAVAAAEGHIAPQGLLEAYEAALIQWPDDAIARFGRANALHALGRLNEARQAYQQLFADHPGHVAALNNLAEVYADLGCFVQAQSTVRKALSLDESNSPLRAVLLDTLARIRENAAKGDAADCRAAPQ